MDDLLPRLQEAVGDTYHVERELGGGGMSRLFLAREHSLDRLVVLKLLPPEVADEVSAERFRREIQLIARLQHPHIVPVLGASSANGLTWYAMPFVKGESLRARLTRDGPLPVPEAVAILAEAADALAYAHRQGVVHRDIKPENILLEEGHAILADFGIAHAAAVAADATRLTATGISIGTLGYMSPEQATGAPQIDGRADLYSLGMVGYELLTGRPPFPGLTGALLVAAQMRDTPPAPTSLRRDLPQDVSDALMRALAKSPDERFPSASEFREALVPPRRGRAPPARWIAAASAVVAVLVIVTALTARRGAPRSRTLDDDVIAVAPFTVLAPELALWQEGLVDVLSRGLDGMGPMRTVAPSQAIKGWSGRADNQSARALAERVGARFVLVGTLQASGKDSARAVATLYDATRGRSLGDIDRREDVERIDRLSDTITVGVVRLLARERSLAITPRATLVGSRSIPAIKEFLQAEQLSRALQFDSAGVHYQRAIELDTTFALAHWGLANSAGWRIGRTEEDVRHFLRAGGLNRGLGTRDSLLVVIDSVRAAEDLRQRTAAVSDSMSGRRALAMVRSFTQRYPDEAIGWYRLGEILLHTEAGFRESPTLEALAEPFERAIAGDAGFAEAYLHAVQLAFVRGDHERLRPLLDAARTRIGEPRLRAGIELVRWIALSDELSDAALRAFVDTISLANWSTGLGFLHGLRYSDSSATIARLFRAAAQAGRQSPGGPPAGFLESASRAFEFHGRLRDARAILPRPDPASMAALARLGVMNAESVSVLLAPFAADSAASRRVVLRLLPFWAWRGDTSAIKAASRNLLSPRSAGAERRPPRQWSADSALVAGFLALSRGDSAEAVRRFTPVMSVPSDPMSLPWVWHAAPLLAARGLRTEALRLTMLGYPQLGFDVHTAEDAEHLLTAARLAERAGDGAAAAAYYGRLAVAWSRADEAFRPYIEEATGALARHLDTEAPKRVVRR